MATASPPRCGEHEPQLFLQQVGPVEPVVVAGDPGQLGGLAGGEVLGVLPQRVATVLQLFGVAGQVHAAQQVPHPAAHHVERLGRPAARCGTGPGTTSRSRRRPSAVSPIHSAASALISLIRLARSGPRRSKKLLQGGPVVTGRGPHQPAASRGRRRPSGTCGHGGRRSRRSRSAPARRTDPGRSGRRPRPGRRSPHGAPGDPHQLDHRRLRAVRDQPGDLIVERSGVPGAMAGPRHRSHRHPVLGTASPVARRPR